MIKKFLTVLILILFLPAVCLAGQFKVVRVYDGDTVKAIGNDIEIKVRLVGIDAPETSKSKNKPGQPFSQKSKKYLTDMVLNKTVFVKGFGTDRYNRILGVVYVDRKNVNLELVKAGLAEAYRGRPAKGFDPAPYFTAEANARSQNRGMWSLGDRYVSPREWRKIKK